MSRTAIKAGDIYYVDAVGGAWWFVENVDRGKASICCLRANISSWQHGQRTDLSVLDQNVIIRNVPDFTAAAAYLALRGAKQP